MYIRSYPTGLGTAIHKVYQDALKGRALAPLRFAIHIDAKKTPAELFQALPLGDIWTDARLPAVFEYLYKCKHVRTGIISHAKVCYSYPGTILCPISRGYPLSSSRLCSFSGLNFKLRLHARKHDTCLPPKASQQLRNISV